MESAVIPPLPGIASAVGMLDAPVRHDFACPVSDFADLPAVFEGLRQRAAEEMRTGSFDTELLVDARYLGQSFELTLPWAGDWDSQRAAFDGLHAERYGFSDPEAEMEVIVARLTATIGQPRIPQELVAGVEEGGVGKRDVWIDGAWVPTPVLDRASLAPGRVVEGPAILNQFDTTTYIRPDQQVRVDEHGFLHLRRTR